MNITWFKLLWREVMVSSPAAIWLFPLIAGGGLLLLTDAQSDDLMRFEQIAVIVEIIIPLGVMFLANGLILREREENSLVFVAIRSSLPKLWLRRLGALLLVSTFWLGILLAIYRFFYFPLSIGQMLLASISVSLALIGVTSIFALTVKEMNAGYLIGIFLWVTCLIARKAAFKVFGPRLYLFYLWFGAREGIGTEAWLYNKLTLAGVGLALIWISVFWLLRTNRFSE
jgi:hypothetical protein